MTKSVVSGHRHSTYGHSFLIYVYTYLQNIKSVFDATMKVVIQPPKQKEKKRRKTCTGYSIL